MTIWLLDTNVLSELRRPNPERRVAAFFETQEIRQLFVSTVSFSEIRYGIEIHPDLDKRRVWSEWLEHRLRPMFENRVLPIDEEVMLRWRLMLAEGRKIRHTFSQPDLLIAATAHRHDMTVVTRDTRQFEIAGVPVRNPWLD